MTSSARAPRTGWRCGSSTSSTSSRASAWAPRWLATWATDVERFLGELFERHGRPRILRSDNGREFIAQQLADYLERQGVGQAFIEKASPQQNAFVERFNGTMRDEILNGETFRSVLEAKVVIDSFVERYNTIRPHRGLGHMTPAAFFESIKAGRP